MLHYMERVHLRIPAGEGGNRCTGEAHLQAEGGVRWICESEAPSEDAACAEPMADLFTIPVQDFDHPRLHEHGVHHACV